MDINPRWKHRPDGSNWGDFGPDDQAGRMNLVTADKVRLGIVEVREGLTFCLSLPLDYPGGNQLNPRRHPPVLRPTLRNGRPNMNYRLFVDDETQTDGISDDLAILHLQYSTQWDSLAHVGQLFDANGDGIPEAVYYNGYRAGQEVVGPASADDAGIGASGSASGGILRSTSAARALGIENMAQRCVQGRAVMIDLRAHFGDERVAVGYEQLMGVLSADRVVVEPGDMVCLHTGFADRLLEMGGRPNAAALGSLCAVLDGRDPRLLQWITDCGLAVLAADNYAVEAHPATSHVGCCAALPLHEHCLFKLGVHLGEIWHLTPLANWLRERGRSRFLLTAPPLRLPGAVGSPVTPVGTV
ncbi:MAG: cyclase family protein [Lautropia sp.]|nr:cyclase family protein [Lautropia sp.]